jgi:hypothetical protein
MSKTSQRPDIVQWYDKNIDRYVKFQRATGEVLSEKVTAGAYKNIHVAKRRPSAKTTERKILPSAKTGTVSKKTAKVAVKTVVEAKAKKVAKPKPPRKPRKVNYLNNKDLMAEVLKSKAQDPPQMTDKLAHMLQTLAARYGKKGNFAGYSYNEDMQAFAMMMLVRTWKAFKPELSQNPFAFFTQCIKNSFIQFLNQESKHRLIRDELMVNQGLDASYAFQEKYQQKMAEQKLAASDDVDSEASERAAVSANDTTTNN